MLQRNIVKNSREQYEACCDCSPITWPSWANFVNVEVKWTREEKGLTDSVWGMDVCVVTTAVAEASKNMHTKMSSNRM